MMMMINSPSIIRLEILWCRCLTKIQYLKLQSFLKKNSIGTAMKRDYRAPVPFVDLRRFVRRLVVDSWCRAIMSTVISNRPGLRHLAALGKIKIGGPSTSAPTSDFSKKKMHMKTHMCWVYMFFKHNFCVKPYGLTQKLCLKNTIQEPRRDPSNRRLNVHVIYLRHCQKSSSQPVPSQTGDDATRPQWRTCIK